MDWEKIDDSICCLIEDIRRESIIKNEVIRDDIFDILESRSTVIYYPLDGEKNRGFHVKRIVKEELRDFVYINTAIPLAEQVFTAAHELGHICNVADNVWKSVAGNAPMTLKQEEDITDRFAADLLMPQDCFSRLFETHMKDMGITGNTISLEQLARLMAFQMNDFLCPYEAVRRRLLELEIISDKIGDILKDQENIQTLVNILTMDQNTYLGEGTRIKTIPGLRSCIENAKQKQVDAYLIKRLETAFELKNIEITKTQIELRNVGGEKVDNDK